MKIKHILGVLVTALCPLMAEAASSISIATAPDGSPMDWGTSKRESYDIAFPMNDPSLAGAFITEISVPFAVAEGTEGYSVWISRSLTLDGATNIPDLASVSASLENGMIKGTFPSPVMIPEEGCYIGYSFSMPSLTDEGKAPVTVVSAGEAGRMMVHTSRTYLKWGDYGLKMIPAMDVTLSGDFHDNEVAVISLPESGALRDAVSEVTMSLSNRGRLPLGFMEVEASVGKEVFTCKYTFEPEVAPAWFSSFPVELEIPANSQPGDYVLEIKVVSVNGLAAEGQSAYAAADFYIYPHLPERIPLMEEFTGTWCGFCPRGMVGMEYLQSTYPDRFIGAAYHVNSDVMNIGADFPLPLQGAPSMYLDRTLFGDPYNGTSTSLLPTAAEGIGKLWLERSKTGTMGMIDVDAFWTDESHSEITAVATSTFVRKYPAERFRVLYLLTHDNMHGLGSDWMQANNFHGIEDYLGTELAPFVDKPALIPDMMFDHVVVYSSDPEGVEGSVPEAVGMLVPQCHTFKIPLSEVINNRGQSLVQDKDRLRLIAAIVDSETKEIVNATISQIKNESGVEEKQAKDLCRISVHDNQLDLVPSEPVSYGIFTADGLTLRSGNIDGPVSVSMPKGLVIVRVSSPREAHTQRILIR